MTIEVGTNILADARRLLEAMEADVADGFMEELDHRLRQHQTSHTSSPTKPWKTLRVYHSHFENAPRFQQLPQPRASFHIRKEKNFDLLRPDA
jgi:hypothetical protein